jgi:hypothetical protein
MSDDAARPTQGNRPGQRRGRGAPTWWDELQRTDLPDDPRAESVVETAGWEVQNAFPGRPTGRSRLVSVVSLLTAVLVAVAVAVAVWVATAATGRSVGATAAVIIGVPATLLVASLLASLAGRRRR